MNSHRSNGFLSILAYAFFLSFPSDFRFCSRIFWFFFSFFRFSPMKFMIIFMFIFARLVDGAFKMCSYVPMTPHTHHTQNTLALALARSHASESRVKQKRLFDARLEFYVPKIACFLWTIFSFDRRRCDSRALCVLRWLLWIMCG